MLEEFGPTKTSKLLSQYTCTRNPDVQNFLTEKAIRFEESGNARTRLILDDDGHILAYFSLHFKELSLSPFNTSKGQVKRMDGISREADSVRAYLIGQLGKNDSVENNSVHLEDILREVYSVINEAQTLVGGRNVILECENTPSLIELYETHGFKVLSTVDTDNSDLVTMHSSIKS